MNHATLKAITQSIDGMSVGEFIVHCARVSNPSNEHNHATAPKLLRYLIAHKHWSPLEMATMVVEVITTRDIARQILRHRSFSFQEFSQRYADPTAALGFVYREPRLADATNRQNSTPTDDDKLWDTWTALQGEVIAHAEAAYHTALQHGIAKEQARAVLPEGLTVSRLYMSGTIRSFVHYVATRCGRDTQREHREIALSIKGILLDEIPELSEVWQ